MIQHIKRLYNLLENENFGFSEKEISELEKRLEITLPAKLREYYLVLGKEENINYSYNTLFKPEEITFSEDGFLLIYEENQGVVIWGIKKEDLILDNPPVYANYDTIEKSDWIIETQTIEGFLLMMAIYNGTFGGLPYNGNFIGSVSANDVFFIEDNFTLIDEISRNNQKIYTDDYQDVISLSFDKENNCTAAFIGTYDQERFDDLIESVDVNWDYLSYDDEDYDEED
ncbi:SMI1/KNR4 family protein [Flavobacterium hungaricum]|uniref:SMI1/KNR4 family protein n=1 Tax=Flavobacterium hungaricum TaxID=2082725 RepID=A0ABR9TLH1_9FLAO|nr:SMI1/KNR4 family protein [Flavobacterium hungaricum]MBE8726212.1 SMI1/KNR4 family protein [Flavobacterium hungaricum]